MYNIISCPTSLEKSACIHCKPLKLVAYLLYLSSYTGGDWLSLVRGGGNWEIRVKGNLSLRADNGRINSSPTTAVSPIVVLRRGATHTITIPGKAVFEMHVHASL